MTQRSDNREPRSLVLLSAMGLLENVCPAVYGVPLEEYAFFGEVDRLFDADPSLMANPDECLRAAHEVVQAGDTFPAPITYWASPMLSETEELRHAFVARVPVALRPRPGVHVCGTYVDRILGETSQLIEVFDPPFEATHLGLFENRHGGVPAHVLPLLPCGEDHPLCFAHAPALEVQP